MDLTNVMRRYLRRAEKNNPYALNRTNNNEGCMLIGHGVIVLEHTLVSVVLAAC